MMNKLRKKMNKKGFTLAELLIVVAIIAILVAVSIPIFTSRLEKSREATDIANMRAAKAAAVAAYLSDDETLSLGSVQTADVKVYYDAENGVLKTDANKGDIRGYGQGTASDGKSSSYMGYSSTSNVKGQMIEITVTKDGAVTMSWTNTTTTPS